jgi:hypothetical protein
MSYIITAKIVELAPNDVYLALFLIAAVIIAIVLIVKSSDEYSVEETEKNSEEFAGEIRDSKGPVTKWLWVVYVGLIIWALAYLVQHWSEFAVFP